MSGLLLIGAGGHARSVLDSLSISEYESIAICDKAENIGHQLYGVPIIGCDNDLERLYASGFTQAVIAVGSVGNPQKRVALYQKLKQIGFTFPVIKDPSAVVSKHGSVGEGTFIAKGAVINAGVSIGRECIINSGAVIDHDCDIGDFVHIAPGCCLSGGVKVGENSHIGTGSAVNQGIHIGSNTIIGVGSVVIKNIADNKVAYGVPCKEEKTPVDILRVK